MCAIRHPIADLCRQIADLEYELEARLCGALEADKQEAQRILDARHDFRAVMVLRRFLNREEDRIEERNRRMDREMVR